MRLIERIINSKIRYLMILCLVCMVVVVGLSRSMWSERPSILEDWESLDQNIQKDKEWYEYKTRHWNEQQKKHVEKLNEFERRMLSMVEQRRMSERCMLSMVEQHRLVERHNLSMVMQAYTVWAAEAV